MARVPFNDFLVKLSKNRAYSESIFRKVIDAFAGTGLSREQIFIFLSLDKKRIVSELRREGRAQGHVWKPVPYPEEPSGGGPMAEFSDYAKKKSAKRKTRKKPKAR